MPLKQPQEQEQATLELYRESMERCERTISAHHALYFLLDHMLCEAGVIWDFTDGPYEDPLCIKARVQVALERLKVYDELDRHGRVLP